MKKTLMTALLASPLFLAACYDTDTGVEVKKDGTVAFESEVIMKKSLYESFTRSAGEDYLKERCESEGGKFDVDIAHVNCKIQFESTLDAIMAGDVQSKYTGAPLDLSGLTIVQNGEGQYAMSYVFDWEFVGETVAAETMSNAADAAEDANEKAEEISEDMEKAAEKTEDDDSADAAQAAQKRAEKIQGDMNDAAEDNVNDFNRKQAKLIDYLRGYTVTIKFKAPKILESNGNKKSTDSVAEMEFDLGDENLPENFEVAFSTEK